MSTVTKKKVRKKASRKKADSGNGILSALSSSFQVQSMEQMLEEPAYRIPFKNHALEAITGGLEAGTVNEFAGDSQSGKSFLFYENAASTIEMGGYVILHDIERALRPRMARRMGIAPTKPGQFILSKEKKMEAVFGLSRKFVQAVRKKDKTCPILIGVDSYPPMTFGSMAKEVEKTDGKDLKGYMQAKKNAILAQYLGDFTTFMEENNAVFVLINQGRTKMGVMFGDDRTTNGEGVIQFYCTLRLWGKVGKKLKDKSDSKKIVGRVSHWDTIKNRQIAPFKKTSIQVKYATGISAFSGLRDLLIDQELGKAVPKKPSLVKYDGKSYLPKRLIAERKDEVYADIRGDV